MSRFESRLDLIQLARDRWILHHDLIYVSDLIGRVVVPREFITDLASVPRLPFAYMLTGDRARGPAVVHDYGYQLHLYPRSVMDNVFLEAMAVHQPELGFEAESAIIRGLMWSGVRAGGWKAWCDHAERAAELNPVWESTGWPPPESP